MNPMFETMPLEELRTYVLTHQSDLEAFHLLVDRLKIQGERATYPCPNTPENIAIMRQAIQEKLGRSGVQNV
jgi:hypothetical protein